MAPYGLYKWDKRIGEINIYGLCWLVLAGLAAPVVLSGCGSSGLRMVSVAGQVTLNGKPLEEGTIDFQDPHGNAPNAQALIRQGAYNCQVLPGRKKVVIQGFKVVGKERASRADPDSPLVDRKEQFLPPKYSSPTSTELTADIGPSGNRSLNFELKIP